jgi:hypothetical protein
MLAGILVVCHREFFRGFDAISTSSDILCITENGEPRMLVARWRQDNGEPIIEIAEPNIAQTWAKKLATTI